VPISRAAVTGPDTQLAAALVESLRRRGIAATVTSTVPPDTDATFFLDASGKNDASGESGDLLERAERAFEAIRGFAASRGSERGILVTVEWDNSALRGGLAVLARTVSLEFPRCSARSIEIESPLADTAAAEMIVDEVLSGAREPSVILSRDGSRKVVEEFALPIGHNFDTSLLSGKPVIVVTGGARGVTAACLMALAGTAPVRLALVGRTRLEPEAPGFESAKTEAELKAALVAADRAQGKPVSLREIDSRARRMLAVREVERSLGQLRQLGAEAEYFAADVTNAADVDKAFAAVRIRWGRVDGLIHAAGVVADKQILEKSPEQFARVFGTKVMGFEALLRAARRDELRFIYVFSSVAGRYGNSGQADYAMANAIMSRMARDEAARRSPACVVRALSWGPWEGGMVTPELRSHFAARGVPLISMDRGVAAFMQEFCHTNTDPGGIDVVLAAHAPAQPSGD
jgi:NAD(P)-dependent dehydrogenase (short-subunit alcohol dehydrogenase family)